MSRSGQGPKGQEVVVRVEITLYEKGQDPRPLSVFFFEGKGDYTASGSSLSQTPPHSSVPLEPHTCLSSCAESHPVHLPWPEKQMGVCSPCPSGMWTREWAWKG